MAKVPPLREIRRPNTHGAIPKNSALSNPSPEHKPGIKNAATEHFSNLLNEEDKLVLEERRTLSKITNNSLVTGLVTGKESVSNPLVTGLVTGKESVSNPLVTGLVTGEKSTKNEVLDHKEPISNRISNRGKFSISNPLVTGLVTGKWKVSGRQITEEMNYLEVKEKVASLSGNQKKIVYLVAKLCHQNHLLSTGPISTEVLRELINGNSDVVKSTIEKLRIKGFLNRDTSKPGKRGNGGFVVLTITAYVRDAVFQLGLISNPLVTGLVTGENAPLVTHKEPDKEPAISSSSSIKSESLKTTTTTKSELPDEWKKIDCAPLREQAEGFGEDHLRRLLKLGTTTPDQIQENIKRIAYAVKYKTQTFNKSPIAMLMGLGKEGKYFDPPKGYGSQIQPRQQLFDQAEPKSTPDEKAAAIEAKRQLAAFAGYLKDMPS